MACKHTRISVRLELHDEPVFHLSPDFGPHKEDEASRTTWMGGVTYRCFVCGKSGRYTGSQIPKWLMAQLETVPAVQNAGRSFGPVEDRANRAATRHALNEASTASAKIPEGKGAWEAAPDAETP